MTTIKQEADSLLQEQNLLNILKRYGEPFVHGSYFLDLMTWRDLDIYIETETINTEKFFELGMKLEQQLKPDQMHFKNGIIFHNDTIPNGLYWCIQTKPSKQNDSWRLDIWMIRPEEIEKFRKHIYDLKAKITEKKRKIILDIKDKYCSHNLYTKSFIGMDIYDPVISGEVTSVEQFKDWIKRKKNVDL